MFLVFCTLFIVCLSQDPPCAPFKVHDPNTGESFVYDLSKFLLPSSMPKQNLIQGKENGQGWTIYANICGNAAPAAGCTEATPACMDDNAGNFFSCGSPNSWTTYPYYDPTKGPNSTPIYNGGVVVHVGNGDVCGNGVARNSRFWLQCDPSGTFEKSQLKD